MRSPLVIPIFFSGLGGETIIVYHDMSDHAVDPFGGLLHNAHGGYLLVNIQKKRWNITFFMGKSTISTGPFSSSQTVNVSQRVTIWTVDTITQRFTGRRYITQPWSYQITPSLGGFLCGNPWGGWARSFAHQKG